MDSGEAEELGRFRANVARLSADELVPVIATVLDELIDFVRSVATPGDVGVEVAAALSAELHRRRQPELVPSSRTGTA